MTNILEKVRGARVSPSAVLRVVLNEFGKNASGVFCFFEGKDAGYYDPRVRSIVTDRRIRNFNCDGKGSLREVHFAIRRNRALGSIHAMYFFDRDYDDRIEDLDRDLCYITPGYAVENFYTSVEAFSRLVDGAFFQDKLYEDDDEQCRLELIQLYEFMQKDFHKEILLFNCWAWVHRKLKPSDPPVRFSQFDVSVSLFSLTDSGARKRYDLASLNRQFPKAPTVDQRDIEQAEKWFEEREPQQSFRGKQEMQFLFRFLSFIIPRGAKGNSPFHREVRCSLRNSLDQMVADLAAYADTPEDLHNFIWAFASKIKSAKSD